MNGKNFKQFKARLAVTLAEVESNKRLPSQVEFCDTLQSITEVVCVDRGYVIRDGKAYQLTEKGAGWLNQWRERRAA